MVKKKVIRAIALLVGSVVSVSSLSALIGCQNGGSSNKDSIVLMTEELNGLFNPFYATSGTDMDVVGMTQIGMLTYDADDEGNVEVVAGDDYAVVSKAYDIDDSSGSETVYTFVIKNGLKFSDGVPLTINDVMFNIYEYLDPVYTGSSTMYSIKIKGLSKYRTQTYSSEGGAAEEDAISRAALGNARTRRQELIDIFEEKGKEDDASSSYKLTEEEMKEAIKNWNVTDGYKEAVATKDKREEIGSDMSYYRDLLLKDYEFVLKTHKEELQSDFKAAKESFDTTTMPYSEHAGKLANDVFKFFLFEDGYITAKYAKDPQNPGRDDKLKIEKFEGEDWVTRYPTEEAAIQRVYEDNITYSLNAVLQYWGTAGTVLTEFTGAATEVVIRNNIHGDELLFPNVEGIVSLGHTSGVDRVNSVIIDGITYKVAHEHNPDGTPKEPDEYDVLRITVDGKDPKAIYSFGFSVAPAHYYGVGGGFNNGNEIDIEHNKFGVAYASSDFQSNAIKSLAHVEVPVGAGPYMATNRDNGDNPSGSQFVNNNIVYYKANPNFMFEVKAEKLRLQVVSPSDALDVLASGAVDYVTPQFTKANFEKLSGMENNGYVRLDSWQLGYGYIGINAGKVPDINIRKAIMAAMDTSLALTYYQAGTCVPISWPMSMKSWAYPYEPGSREPGVGKSKLNGHDYTVWNSVDDAKTTILEYMSKANPQSSRKIKFTIAGASITEHPTYEVFKNASKILNELGWDITVSADTQALTKLSTGSLEVWAAAWGSAIDPDLYQVYHKNSSATSTYAWGYREIFADTKKYSEEVAIINELSAIIDEARETMDRDVRTEKYEVAMRLVLDLAVELPVYQRQNLYAYNGNTVRGFSAKVNAYTSPLDKVWELELIK